MTFSSAVKEEIARSRVKRRDCRLAELSALLHVIGSLQLGAAKRVRLATESYAVARSSVALCKSLYPIETEILVRERRKLGKNRSFTIVFEGEGVSQLLADTGLLKRGAEGMELGEGIEQALLKDDECRRAFLRGVFLGGGSVTDPTKTYHLECVMPGQMFADDLVKLMDEYELHAKVLLRKGSCVVYLKEGDKIIEFLTLIGAHNAILSLENVRILKDMRNNLNRVVNCETANIDKTVNAAQRQIENIRLIERYRGLETLPEPLREMAEIRLNHPDAPLSELCTMLGGVGKSGVNHRLRRLENIAHELRTEKGEW